MRADLTSLSKSLLVRVWLLLLVISFIMMPVAMLASSRANPIPASSALAAYLSMFLTIWSTVIIVLSAGSVSSEADIVADGILSRACTRTQYIFAKIFARVFLIGGVYLIGSGAAAYAVWRYGLNDVTWMTMLTGIAIVGMALLMLISIGVTFSVVFNNTIISIIGLLLLWYVAGTIFAFAGADYMSPTGLTRNLPQILRDSTPPKVVSCSATQTSLSVKFSKQINIDSAELAGNYSIESHGKKNHEPKTVVYNKPDNTVILSGFKFDKDRKVTVKVEGVTDLAGNLVSPADDTAVSKPVSISGSSTAESTKEKAVKTTDEETSKKDSGKSSRTLKMPPGVIQVNATSASASVVFSQEMNSSKAENLKNYTIESPLGAVHTPKSAAYNGSMKTVLLSGLSFKKGDPVKVSVKNVTSLQGKEISPNRNSAIFREVYNWKYFAGFGLPAILFMLLGVIWFSRRDL
ncbi:MAG: ABC transporter permease [Armatimonadota bacterium]